MTALTPRLASAGREPRQARRLGLTALVVDVLVRLADAYIRAENAALRHRQAAVRTHRGASSASAGWPAQAPPTTITTAALAVTNGRALARQEAGTR